MKKDRNVLITREGSEDEQVVNVVEEREAPSERHSPAFKVGEVVSIKGDTTERGHSSLFIYFLRHASYFRR